MRVITDLHPRLQKKVKELQEKCEKQGLKIGISECVRSVAEQDALYAKGRTAPGAIVTNARGSSYSSMHQWGVAFDFYRNDGKGAYNNSDKFFNKVGQIGISLGLEWGGNWKSIKDLPHFQLPDWGSTTTTLKSKYKTPDGFKKTWGTTSTSSTIKESASNTTYSHKQFVKDIQKALRVNVDGIAGPKTIAATITLSSTKNRTNSALIKPIQKYLKYGLGITEVGTIDGIAGDKFTKAIKKFQTSHCEMKNGDGVISAKGTTWKKLLGQ